MKSFRKFLCSALVVMLCVAAVLPAFADDVLTYYLPSKDGGTYSTSISVNGTKEDSKVSAVKSSNKEVVTVNRLYTSQSSNYYYDRKETVKNNPNFNISFTAKKAGKATVSYKLDGEKQNRKILVKDYTNPVKSLTITGISSKNLKSAFDNDSYYNKTLSKDATAGKLTFKAAAGWKLRSMYWEDLNNNCEYEFYSWNGGVSSSTLNVPKMLKDNPYYISCTFTNTKTNGEIHVTYRIN